MPNFSGKKIPIVVYLDPDTYRAIEDSRRPEVPRSVFCSTALEELFRGFSL